MGFETKKVQITLFLEPLLLMLNSDADELPHSDPGAEKASFRTKNPEGN